MARIEAATSLLWKTRLTLRRWSGVNILLRIVSTLLTEVCPAINNSTTLLAMHTLVHL
jgi:hypothetical protein|tara:strand:- start:1538 stop:1711 length:174 start_codon:yes stop_codon:yes gene_type:complete